MMPSQDNVIALITFKVTPKEFDAVVRTAAAAIRQGAAAVPGFIDGIVLTDETKTHILIHTEWASRESWAKGEWDRAIADDLVDLFEATASYDIKLYFPLARAKGP